MLASTLEDLGLEAEGVGTVEIDLWNREVSFGPLTVGAGGTAPARVGRFGLGFSGSQLFGRRGFGKNIVIEGVALDIVRSPGGQIVLNGIDIFELAERFSESGEPNEESEPWGLGVRSLELRDSVAHFRAPDGGEVDIDIARLLLSGFRTWNREEPGQFLLTASINDIDIEIEGQAQPFAEIIRAKATTQISGFSLPKIERYFGPLPLAQGDGSLAARLENELVIERDGSIDVSHDGQVGVQGLVLRLPDGPAMNFVDAEIIFAETRTVFTADGIDLSGSVSITGSESVLALAPDQSIELEEVTFGLDEIDLSVVGRRTLSGSFDAELEAGRGVMRFAGANGGFGSLDIAASVRDLAGTSSGDVRADIAAKISASRPALDVGRAPADLPPALAVSADTLDLDLNAMSVSRSAEASPAWNARASLAVRKIDVAATRADSRLAASLGSLDVQNAEVDQVLDVRLGLAVIEAFAARLTDGQGEETLRIDFDSLAGRGIERRSPNSFGANDVALAGLDIKATSALLAARRGDENVEVVRSDPPPQVSRDTGEAPGARGIEIKLGRVQLTDPANISLVDERFSPAAEVSLALDTLSLADIDTTDPDMRATFSLAATVNEFTGLKADGWIEDITGPSNFELSSNIERLELPSFSQYAAKHLGVNLETGRLTAAARGTATDGVLDLATDIEVLKLKFSPLSAEDADRLSAVTGVPVGVAVGLLEDSNGLISLSIPIRGNIDSPDFDLSQAINKAVGGAITGAISTTIKVLFPPTLLLSLLGSDGPGAGIKFEPAPFEAGTAVLQPGGQELLASMSALLQQRPRLTVTVCGRATADDLRATLATDIERVVQERRTSHARAMASYRNQIQPFVSRGIVDSDGKVLVSDPPDTLPGRPEAPVLDEGAVVAELAVERADALRSSLTSLAAERTRVVRRGLNERGITQEAQIAECRPLYDPADTAGPRAIVRL